MLHFSHPKLFISMMDLGAKKCWVKVIHAYFQGALRSIREMIMKNANGLNCLVPNLFCNSL